MTLQDIAVNIQTAQDLWPRQPREAISVLYQTLQVHLRARVPETDPADPWPTVKKIAQDRNDIEFEAAYSYVKWFDYELERDMERDDEDWERCVLIAAAFLRKLEQYYGNPS